MRTIQAAIDARVSSAQQAEAHTVASQGAAWRERIVAEGLTVPEALPCIDEGSRGATLVRPALERWRDLAAAGAVDRLSVQSPDRLARTDASQVLLVDELQQAGVEVIFLNRELGRSPEDDLLLHVQGMMAEDERAKIIERHRRGKLQAARAGIVNVLSGAPSGYRYIPTSEGRGQAHDDVVPEEARVVRQVFDWVGRERWTIGEVCRRLTRAGEVTHPGKTVWERRVVGGMLKNPAYMGRAAFGKTRQGPLQPRLRAQRGRPLQPKRAVSSADVPPEAWRRIPVPAIIEPELFEAVQEQWRANQRHARHSRRGALYVLQGLVQCGHCSYAYDGKRLSPSARTGHPRAYAYDRGLGTDAYRFGGERVWPNTPVRTALLELAVWQEGWALLAHPERLAEEYQRRVHADRHPKHTTLTTLAAQLGKLRQGLVRLLDSYTEGLIDKPEFEPRLSRLRQRIAHLEAQRQQLVEEAALHTELHLIMGRLETFAAQVRAGLVEAEWRRKRELIRALVKRVEVAHDQGHVVFRIEPRPGDPSPEKKRLQDWRGSQPRALRCPLRQWGGILPLERAGLQKAVDQVDQVGIMHSRLQSLAEETPIEAVEEILQVGFHYPAQTLAKAVDDRLNGLVRRASRPKAIATRTKAGLEQGLQDIEDGMLHQAIRHRWNADTTRPPIAFHHHDAFQGTRLIGMLTQRSLDVLQLRVQISLERLQRDAVEPFAAFIPTHRSPGGAEVGFVRHPGD